MADSETLSFAAKGEERVVQEATIRFVSRDVKGTPTKGMPGLYKGKAQHPFVVCTDSAGRSFVIRGGPDNDNMLTGDLQITVAPYIGHRKFRFQEPQ